MPLQLRNTGNLDEEPLAGNVLEARLHDAEFHSTYIRECKRMRSCKSDKGRKLRTTGVNKDLGQPGRAPRPNLTPYTLAEVDDTGPDGEPPALVTKAVFRRVEREDFGEVRVN